MCANIGGVSSSPWVCLVQLDEEPFPFSICVAEADGIGMRCPSNPRQCSKYNLSTSRSLPITWSYY